MTKAIRSIFLLTHVLCNVQAQSPSFEWARTMSWNSHPIIMGVTADGLGNSYVCGDYDSPYTIIGSDTLLTSSQWRDCFVTKLDQQGNPIWSRAIRNSYWKLSSDISYDGNGHLYIAGYSEGDSIFSGNQFAEITGFIGLFIVKMDTSGNTIWIRSFGGSDLQTLTKISSNASNVVITGDTYSYDFIAGQDTLPTSNGWNPNAYILDVDGNGNAKWLYGLHGQNNERGNDLAIDEFSNVYWTGEFFSDTLFGENNYWLNDSFGSDIFISKLDSAGNLIWLKTFGGDRDDKAMSVCTLPNNTICFSGYDLSDSIRFSTNYFFYNNQAGGTYVANMDTSGNILWVDHTSTTSFYDMNVCSDQYSNIYLSGEDWAGAMGFGPDSVYAPVVQDPYIFKFSSLGNPQWGIAANGDGLDRCHSICVDAMNTLWMAGESFSPSLQFGNLVLGIPYYQNGNGYVAKLSTVLGTEAVSSQENCSSVYPNPFGNIFTLKCSSARSVSLEIFDCSGAILLKKDSGNEREVFDLSEFPNGTYFLRIVDEEKVSVKMIIKAG